jgi:serine/arginine repetitive matrix protein 2
MSRSLGKTRKHSRRKPPTGTFDFLAERTILGHQAIPSAIHTTTNPFANPAQTISRGGQATRSSSSAFPRLRSKSHGHSNSIGTILDSSGHRRKESISSVLRRAKSAATGICVGADRTSGPPDTFDTFAEKDDTKAITTSGKPRGATPPDNVVLISPAVDQNWTSPDRSLRVPAPQRLGVSPTPSSQTQFAEGVGVAISSPVPSEEHPNDETIIFPTHPYAQGANNHHRPPVNATPQPLEAIHHRQPIVHPYAIHSVRPATSPQQWVHRDRTFSPARRMSAEVIPGHLREIRPEEIQYSPYAEEAPRVFTTARAMNRPVAVELESADPPSHRDSDTLGMGDALSLSLVRDRSSSSTDSGIGASEDHHPYGSQSERTASSRPNTFSPRQVHELLSVANDNRGEGPSHNQWLQPPSILPRTGSFDSDPTSLRTASSGQVNPPVFSGTPTPMRPYLGYNGSSPGLSNDSSPPLTPRPLDRLDDLERFQDLFYNPTASRPRSSEPEDWQIGTTPVNLTRSRSQLTTLVRQLSEDLHELRNGEPIPEDDGPNHPSRVPVASVGIPSSDGSPPVLEVTQPFLPTHSSQHPLDQPVTSSRQNFPEDVESEISSLSDRIPEEDYDETTGSYSHPPGNIEANCPLRNPTSRQCWSGFYPAANQHPTSRIGLVSSIRMSRPPSLTPTPGHVTLIDDTINPTARVISSTLTLPSTGLTRSSYLTLDSGGSRISGLSAFPRPPSEQSVDILASYFVSEADDNGTPELTSAALENPATAQNQGEWSYAL